MTIHFHPHAQDRMKERGATENEVKSAIEHANNFQLNSSAQVSGAIFLLTARGVASIIKRNR